MLPRLALLAILLASACTASGPSFTPATVEYSQRLPPRIVMHAALAYSGDMDTLAKAGGTVLGWVTRHYVERASLEAASVGGSHLVFLEQSTQCTSFTSHCLPKTESRFAVVRVEPSRWSELPDLLKPRATPELLEAGCECKVWGAHPDLEWALKCRGHGPDMTRHEVRELCGGARG